MHVLIRANPCAQNKQLQAIWVRLVKELQDLLLDACTSCWETLAMSHNLSMGLPPQGWQRHNLLPDLQSAQIWPQPDQRCLSRWQYTCPATSPLCTCSTQALVPGSILLGMPTL